MTLAIINLPYFDYSLWVLLIFLALGFVALNFGGDFLTRGAVAIANNLNINPVIVGLTIVSMATSMPEMMTSLLAAKTSPGLALGNILGSNIANIGLILGISALITPLSIQLRLIQREVPLLIVVTGLFSFFAIGGYVRWKGIVLITILLVYLYFLVRWAKQDSAKIEDAFAEIPVVKESRSTGAGAMFILLGGVLLAIGADVLVGTSVELAGRMGISDVLIGLTIVAIGTSLPELAASVSAARSGHGDICVGNVIGSNLFNILLIGGGVASIVPIPVDSRLFWLEFPAMMFITLLLLWVSKNDSHVSRKEGLLLLLLYISILALSSFFHT